METASLKSFAMKARTDLLKQVAARLDFVLAPGSNERAEQPGSVAALERAVTQTSREEVVDLVAYTWFNRIIALRFMDAKGYTSAGVVSPEAGKSTGQPQVLSDAKGGDFENEVVSAKTRAAVSALLAPGAHGADPQGAAYGLLLESYSRYWNTAMPFMFEREGDYTELLMPTGLLSADSVRGRAVAVLTEEVCADVEVIGWLYQFYISERKDEVFNGFKKNKKAGAAEIPAATQLFTPHWIVRYLVENSLGRLWLLNHPNSRLAEQMDYYIAPVDEETDFLKVSRPEDLEVIDPAVGSGHMLTYAFDLLYAIYEEEGYTPSEIPGLILEHNLYGIEIDPRAGALAAFALTMKAAARRKLFLKNPVQPRICVLQNLSFDSMELDYLWSLTKSADIARADADAFWNAFEHANIFGSLIQPEEPLITPLKEAVEGTVADGNLLDGNTLDRAHSVLWQASYLSRQYSVVVANPPYMGNKTMDAVLVAFAKRLYEDAKADTFSMFIDRCLGLAGHRGLVGMITMQSWMFLTSFEKLRSRVLRVAPPTVMAHLGPRAFDSIGGAVVSTSAFVLEKGRDPNALGIYYRLVAGGSEAEKADLALGCIENPGSPLVARLPAASFRDLPGEPVTYWLSNQLLELVKAAPSIDRVLMPRQGLFTTDNTRFMRYFWEVSWSRTCITATDDSEALKSGARWFAHHKGGTNRKWFGNYEHVVEWEDLGARIKQTAAAKYPYLKGNVGLVVHDDGYYFQPAVSWSDMGGAEPAFRLFDEGFTFNNKGTGAFWVGQPSDPPLEVLGLLNSPIARTLAPALNPSMSFGVNNFRSLPLVGLGLVEVRHAVRELVSISRADWDSFETSWHFSVNPLVSRGSAVLRDSVAGWLDEWDKASARSQQLEESSNLAILEAAGLDAELSASVELSEITLLRNRSYRYRTAASAGVVKADELRDLTAELISYAVGCLLGRYSLDEPGLVIATQGSTLQDYLAQVPTPSFMPDKDNVIPIVDGDWFEDDIVSKIRQFLRVAFGEQHFGENLKFVLESLGVNDLREYFIKTGTKLAPSRFYDDHVSRYKKRPIYWLFSSPKGSFNALVYLHRYDSSTVSTVLNDYLREFIKKLEAEFTKHEHIAASGAIAREVAAAQKEADRIRKVLIELNDYERDLYNLASQQIALDLDDGVLVNYQKFGTALRDIGLKKGNADD
jgi:hypothetical protein